MKTLHIFIKKPVVIIYIKLVHLLTVVRVTKLSAGNPCIKSTPGVITYSAPPVVHTHLYSPSGGRCSGANKPDVSMSATLQYLIL